MNKIKKLSDEIVSKIAAGEVIERPAYAIKELIENSLDARAGFIKTELEESGLSKIIITDNGTGMTSTDAKLSFLPHTTSKITTEEELVGIKTLGFRGEALSSIAAISKLTIRSRNAKDKSGTEVIINSSKIKSIKPMGMPNGTQIIVEDIFSSVPARKKFLKTIRTEYHHILETVINSAISNENVEFEFINNKKQIFHFTKKQKRLERINYLFGETIASNLIPLKFDESYIEIKGFIGRPQVSFKTTNKIYLFVNGRRIFDTAIFSAVRDAYSNLLEVHNFPVAVLFLKLPFDLVDVNVHPRKEIIKFINQQEILQSFTQAVSQTLKSNNLTFYNISWQAKSTSNYASKVLKTIVLNSDIAKIGKLKKSSGAIQMHNLYLVTETKSGIVFIDQHAAHEAILYRKFREEFLQQKNKSISTKVDKPILLNVSLGDNQIIKNNWNFFEKIGFKLEEFGENSYKVVALPKILREMDIASLILEMIEDLREEKKPHEIDLRTNKMLSFLACKSAIKSGQKLAKYDIKKLIGQLQKEDYIYTCPHGRPVKIEISLNELAKLFYRK